MAKKTTDKKKKGPKGKIARAKAKLERQWGEVAKEVDGARDDGVSKKRVGRSRLLSRKSKQLPKEELPSPGDIQNEKAVEDWIGKKNKNDHNNFDGSSSSCNDSDDDDDDDDDGDNNGDEEEIMGKGAFYSKLLKNIQKRKQANEESDEEDSIDDEEENSPNNNTTTSRIEEDSGQSDDDEEEEEEPALNTYDENQLDLFGDRFSCSIGSLPEDDTKREEIMRQRQQTCKVGVPHVDPMLELHVSKDLLEEIIGKNGQDANKIVPKSVWTRLSRQAFSCNRDVVTRQWNELTNRANNMESSFQSVVYPFLARYADCLVTCKSKKHREQASNMAVLHMINHVLTSRGRIQRHNRKLKVMTEAEGNNIDENDIKMKEDDDEDEDEDEVFKDQGYTRPTVLVLLPTRGACYAFVQRVIQMVDGDVPKEYLERFDREYGAPEDDEEDNVNETEDSVRRHRKKILQEKGADWQELFGDETNNDDDFKIGLALNAKNAKSKGKKEHASNGVGVKLYTDFYGSDFIVASPLGLKMALSSESNEGESDFLSSIEICLIDRSDVLMMQNWDHVNDVLDSLNLLPKHNNETDFSRVRNYFLAGHAAHWRQTIFFSTFLDPVILSSFKRFAKSRSGVLKTRQKVLEDEGSIANVIVPLRQVFQRIPITSFSTASEDRMKHLTQKILPAILNNNQKHTLIYIPSYFDFVLLRNYLIKQEAHFVSVTEYSRVSETSRGRARFLQGRNPLMLYTGRAHFFLRHKIKGIRNLIFFGLPEHQEFYADLVNVLNEGLDHLDAEANNSDALISSIALFTKYEAHALERIVGTKQSNRMVKGDKSTFMFLS